MDYTELESLISQYHQGSPDVIAQIEPILRTHRRQLAENFLNLSPDVLKANYETSYKPFFYLMRKAGLQNVLRDEPDEQLANRIMEKWNAWPSANVLLGAMIMFQPHELSLPRHFRDVESWFCMDYAQFLLTAPGVFNQIGEADQFADFFMGVIDLFHQSIVVDNNFEHAQEICYLFVQKASFIQFYFNEKQLKSAYRKRAEILEFWALNQNIQLSYNFSLRKSAQKIKMGILSAHFSPQTETYLLLSYFDKLPRETFHIILYSLRQTNHPLENHCRTRVDEFVILPDGAAYQQKAERIRQDDLDILLIGTNTSAVSNPIAIMALFRMARAQVIVENSPVSTGFTHTDYYISSEFNEPKSDAQTDYTEKLYRVPGMLNYYAYHFDKDPKTINISRAQLNLPEDAVLYFSGANFFKILPELSRLWAWILAQVPNSFLVLMPFNPNWTSHYLSQPFMDRIHTQLAQAGVEKDRVRIVSKVPTRKDVHEIMSLCDVYLDSFPYAGACSMIDPLTVRLPVVTRAGKTMRGNLASAMLSGAGLDHMIASDVKEYEQKAVALGRDKTMRENFRRHIEESLGRYNPFFDTAACGVKIAGAFVNIAEQQHKHDINLFRQSSEDLKKTVINIAEYLARKSNMFFQRLMGNEIIRLLLLPYFESLSSDAPRHLVDAHAQTGQFAAPFLEAGWSADLFEPNADEAARYLENQQVRVFHQAFGGSFSPYGIQQADLLKFSTNTPMNLSKLFQGDENNLPRIITADLNFPENHQTLLNFVGAMKHYGYDALYFYYGKKQLTGMAFADMEQNPPSQTAGNMMFFRENDPIFLMVLIRLLNDFLTAQEQILIYKGENDGF